MSLTQDIWRISINVREYLVSHYTPYDGDESFLAPPTPRTLALWGEGQGVNAGRTGAWRGL